MTKALENLEKSNFNWGYLRKVGSWGLDRLTRTNSDEPEKRFQDLLNTLEAIIFPLKKLHVLEKVEFDLAVLGEAVIEEDGENRIEEKEFLELIELKVSNLDEVIPTFKNLSLTYSRFIIPTIFMYLGTKVKIGSQEFACSESAELSISTSNFATVGEKDKISIVYYTYIDVWLKETLDPLENFCPRDNTQASRLNHPRLIEFLLTLEKNIGSSFEKEESDYYSDHLQRIGFVENYQYYE